MAITYSQLVDFLKEKDIQYKDYVAKFNSYLKFRNIKQNDTDIILLYSSFVDGIPIDNPSWKTLKARQNVVSSIKTIWSLSIFSDYYANDPSTYTHIQEVIRDFYDSLAVTTPSETPSIVSPDPPQSVKENIIETPKKDNFSFNQMYRQIVSLMEENENENDTLDNNVKINNLKIRVVLLEKHLNI